MREAHEDSTGNPVRPAGENMSDALSDTLDVLIGGLRYWNKPPNVANVMIVAALHFIQEKLENQASEIERLNASIKQLEDRP